MQITRRFPSWARNCRPSFRENKPKTLVFNDWIVNTSVLGLFSRKRGSTNSGTGKFQSYVMPVECCSAGYTRMPQSAIKGYISKTGQSPEHSSLHTVITMLILACLNIHQMYIFEISVKRGAFLYSIEPVWDTVRSKMDQTPQQF